MSNFSHGIKVRQQATSLSTPNVASSGVPIFIGTAPVHQVGGTVQQIVMAMNFGEAEEKLGYSDNWESYTLCEAIYSHFRLFGMGPCFFINALDPETHKKTIANEELHIIDGKGELSFDALKATIQLKKGADALAEGTDYLLFYNDGKLLLEALEGGKITPDTKKLSVSYDAVDPTLVTKDDIIGGYNLTTKKTTGIELISDVFPKYQYVPDLLAAPGFSSDPEVAVLLTTKAEAISGQFTGHAVLDGDCKTVLSYQDVPAWKKQNNLFSPRQILCWPKAKLGDKVFHLSTLAIGRMALTDYMDDCPAQSPSNKGIFITNLVLDDEENTEVYLDEERANYLNQNGIVTASNFGSGMVLWGNNTACYPPNTDPKDYFININRMMSWVGNTIIHTLRDKVDLNIKVRIIEYIVDTMNSWLNGLVAEEKILGGRVEFRPEENSEQSLLSGKVVLHYSLGFSPPLQNIDNILEYDVTYLSTLFSR